MMASVSYEHLLAALDNLEIDKLKRFKGYLKIHYSVPSNALENSDVLDTVNLVMNRFGPGEAVKTTVDILRKMNQNHLAEQLEEKHKQETVPSTRNDFLQYSLQLSLDLNTMNKHLSLSEENRMITDTDTLQSYPDHPDRFDDLRQVLCRESVSDRRCYWEIEWRDDVSVSVSYKSISRKGEGDECLFGGNDQSWSLDCSPDSCSFTHNDIDTELPVKPICSRIGVDDDDDDDVDDVDDVDDDDDDDDDDEDDVESIRLGVYVDHTAGTLSFYSVSGDTMFLIHTVQTTFTQPLYPGFGVYDGSSVKLC